MLIVVLASGCRPAGERAGVDEPGPSLEPEPAPAPAPVTSWRWEDPYCFAYAPSTRRYACVSLGGSPSAESDYDVCGESIFATVEHLRAAEADLELGVALVDPDRVDAYEQEVALVIDQVRDPEDPRPLVAPETITAELEAGGFVGIVERRELIAGQWVEFAGVELRFDLDLHEGDASFEYDGGLSLRCEPGGAIEPVEFAEDLGGPLAVVARGDSSTIALTVEHQDGGEGYCGMVWRSWVFDVADYCGDTPSSN